MPHLYVIAVLVSVSLVGASSPGLLPAGVPDGWRLAIAYGPFAGLLAAAGLGVAWCVRRLDRRGDPRAVRLAHRLLGLARLGGLAWHFVGLLVVGALGPVRRVVGDLVLADELVASAPALLVLIGCARLAHPIEARVRAAMFVRTIDGAQPVYAFPGPWAYTLGYVRNTLAIMAVPLLCVLAYSEGLDRLLPRLPGMGEPGPGVEPTAWQLAGPPGLRLAGSIAIFALIPPLMVRVWDTVRIGPGLLRTDLERLAGRHRVRVRDFLVWRTGGAMLNAAVIGLTPWLRYIVLTDALLDRLSEPEVEAVAAHEVAHVRKRHMLWLALAVLGAATLAGEGTALGLDRLGLPAAEGLGSWLAAGASLVAVVVVLGLVSRRFEWQADAFAARHLSGGPVITREAADAMSSALARVSRLNGMPESRFTWRHGSIATRRRRLDALVGRPVGGLPIDRVACMACVLTAIGFCLGLGLTVAGLLGVWPYARA